MTGSTKCLLVGSGFGEAHAAWLSQIDGVSIDGLVVRKHNERTEALRDRYAIPSTSGNGSDLFASGAFDLAVIVTPRDSAYGGSDADADASSPHGTACAGVANACSHWARSGPSTNSVVATARAITVSKPLTGA